MKNQAEMQLKKELDTVVMGRPVRFHDTDDKIDRLAQETLEQIAKDQGFKVVAFQYEPIAAALTYEQQITSEELALIVDLGGGTSDFTVIRLSPYQHQKTSREQDVLANHGIHIGGTDFDRLLSLKEVMPNFGLNGKMRGLTELIDLPSSYFHDLTTWHKINELYHPKIIAELKRILAMCTDKNKFQRFIATIEQRHGHRLLNDIEKAKRSLSIESDILLNLAYIENEFSLLLTRSGFERAIASQVKALGETIYETLQKALVTPQAIHAVFFTGGSTQIPCVYQLIQSFFPESKLIRGDVYGSVGYGLTLDAKKRFS